ncbi:MULTISPECIES: hypothetical protein [Planktothrix]|uniref:Uncharacterized protein n=1 Tax=Planktothrix mougeotii LEGE 06226 TaxID=1828728 RepID=A0ABR9UG03_9CYAN|nr:MULTISPECIES: hypothetical protein [Planktothrix]MBD2482230.1 hypothetical protein [Planktothrix sp. FACHB-1365]MBE9145378.1 hypothetical protein [Planktothrix mougeotii LEGE 06226]
MNNKYTQVKEVLSLCLPAENVVSLLEQVHLQLDADPDTVLEVVTTIRDFSQRQGCSFGTAFSLFRQCRNLRDWQRLKNL